jgi:hypothetical protein
MITFITLFLSLISGIHPVEVAVDGPVARVEILLDRELVGKRTKPPWRVRCDFGPTIMPHELVAIAYDADGSEIHRTRQLVNLPRARAETRIAFVSDENGVPTAVKVIWETAEQIQPLGVYAIFDGQVLQPDAEGNFPLPEYDPEQVHIVTAEAQFFDGITAHSDVTFGGRYGSQVVTELTAVPVMVDRGKPKLEDLEGAFRARGEALITAAVERLGAKVFLVRDHAAVAQLEPVRRRQDVLGGRYKRVGAYTAAGEVSPKEDQLYVVVPNPEYRKGRQLYPTSPGMSIKTLGLGWLVTHVTNPDASIAGQQLSEAVAVAGVQAAAEGAPRAVLLVLSDDPMSLDGNLPQEVRSYLRSLRVPLYVWSTGESSAEGWGPAAIIESSKGFEAAVKAMKKDLARQWIVWVEGNHMINEIELDGKLKGYRLAGTDR